MKIQRLVIENFKSIERIELIEPNPFTVFVGPNGSGKSNIFEALEFVNRCSRTSVFEAYRAFGGLSYIRNRILSNKNEFHLRAEFNDSPYETELRFKFDQSEPILHYPIKNVPDSSQYRSTFTLSSPNELKQFYKGFYRLFIKKVSIDIRENPTRTYYQDDTSLNFAGTNLEPVLKRVLLNPILRDEIFEWLELFVPGFEAVEVDERYELRWFESSLSDYFTRDLISDGTYNILALLTAVYQSDDEPQFLCIEEPENGLNPKVIAEFVNLCRYACEEFGHFIWLNTHSQSLVSKLTTDEIILVDKVDGATQTKQVKGMNLHDLPVDEAWLSNALGGGIPW